MTSLTNGTKGSSRPSTAVTNPIGSAVDNSARDELFGPMSGMSAERSSRAEKSVGSIG